MPDTDEQIRSRLEQLVIPGPVDHTRVWDDLVDRRRRRRHRRMSVAIIPVVLLLGIVTMGTAALDRSSDERSDLATDGRREPSVPAVEELLGRTFRSDSVEVGGERRPLVPGTVIRVSFGHDQASDTRHLSWQAGCNSHGARLVGVDATLEVGDVVSSQVRCPYELAEQDRWLADLFASEPRWSVDDGRLTLTSGETVIELVVAAEGPGEPAAALSGRTFESAVVEEDGELRPLVPGTTISLSFPVDPASGTQHLAWHAGCNSGGGPLVDTESRFRLVQVGSTLAGCPDDLAAQDRWLWSFFSDEPWWVLTGDVLTLTRGDTVITLTAQE